MPPNRHILIVEDDLAIRTMLRGILTLNNFTVSDAACQAEAVEKMDADPEIAVVILDLGLPPNAHDITEGIATLKTINADAFGVKVIVLTGQDQAEAALEAIREGAFDFLSKPASVESILSATNRAFLFVQKERELNQEGITRIAINANIGDGLKSVRDDAEERLVRQVLKETGFNVYQSAKRLGVKRENIYYFLKKFGIQRDG